MILINGTIINTESGKTNNSGISVYLTLIPFFEDTGEIISFYYLAVIFPLSFISDDEAPISRLISPFSSTNDFIFISQ